MVSLQDGSEDEFGHFPISRDFYAKAIRLVADSGARSIVFKFFIDSSKDAGIEKTLERALSSFPVVMQMELSAGPIVNSPENMTTRDYPSFPTAELPVYSGGYFPLDALTAAARSTGYANARLDEEFLKINLLSKFQDKVVPSMVLLAFEEAVINPASLAKELSRTMLSSSHIRDQILRK